MSESYDIRAAPWVLRVSDSGIERVCGTFALERGMGYADAERVTSISTGDQGRMLLAVVEGGRAQPYSTMVTATGDELDGEPTWTGRCSCPVQVACKHVVAVLLSAREAMSAATERPVDVHAWRKALACVVADDEPEAFPSLGLVVRLARRPASLRDSTPRETLELRPTRRTKTGRWSRTTSWEDFRYRHAVRDAERRQVQVIRELVALAGAERPLQTLAGARPQVDLAELSGDVWRLLRRAVDRGIVLLPDPDGEHDEVVLHDRPAEVELVVGDEDGGALEVTAAADHGIRGGRQVLLGSPAHGLAVVEEARITLVPFAEEPAEFAAGLLGKPPLLVPAEDVPEFTSLYLPRMSEQTPVRAGSAVTVPESAGVRLHLSATAVEAGHVDVALSFLYGDDHRVPVELDERAEGRHRRAERHLVELLLPDLQPLGLTAQVGGLGHWPVGRTTLDGMPAVHLIAALDDLAARADVVVEAPDDLPSFEESDADPLVQLSTADTGSTDWFDLDVSITLDGEKVPFIPLFQALARGEQHMFLDSGTWFSLQHPVLERLHDLILEARELSDPQARSLQINRFQVGLWDELVSLGVVGEQAVAWEASAERLRDLDKLVAPEIPAGFTAQLRPYQEEGFAWLATLWDAGLGGVLADDMGLGKTVQTLALLARAYEAGEIGGDQPPVLVVAPTSVVGTWASEAATFAPDIPVVTVGATSRRRRSPLGELVAGAGIVVTSYAVLRLDDEAFHGLPWRGLVLDEAQMVKNHHSKTYQAARKVGAPFTLAVSGTPLENSLMDLWSLLSLSAPGLYPRPDEFTELYRRPIESGKRPELLDQLRRRIRPLMLRRTKDQVASDLPEKQIQKMMVPLAPAHSRIYEAHLQRERQRIMGLLGDPEANRVAILASLTRLRQMALDPALVDESYAGVATSAKVSTLVDQLREIREEGHRALVFSQFTSYLKLAQQSLHRAGVSTCYLDGTMTAAARTRTIKEFKQGESTAFLISLKAGGVGLTLTEADYVYVLDPWWNPAAEAQAIDRTHRIGQDKPVMVYRMVSGGTIEEKVVALQDRKRDLFDRVIDDGGSLSGQITAADIRALLD